MILYKCYIWNSLALTGGLILGNLYKSPMEYEDSRKIVPEHMSPSFIIKFIILIIGVYAFFYFSFIKHIPLIELFKNFSISKQTLAFYRQTITHDYEGYYSIPFLFRYYRIFLQVIPLFIVNYLFVFYLNSKHKTLFFIFLLFTIFTHTYTLEKSYIVKLLLSLFITYSMVKKLSIKKIFWFSCLLLIVIASMYVLFMGTTSFRDSIRNPLRRLVIGQTESIYLQNQILEEEGFLRGKSIPMPIIDNILKRKIINLSKIAYQEMFSKFSTEYNVVGAAGTTPVFYYYQNFGLILGVLIVFFLNWIIGMFDSVMSYKIIRKEGYSNFGRIALYSVLAIFFSNAAFGTYLLAFSFPWFFSVELYVIFVCYFLTRLRLI